MVGALVAMTATALLWIEPPPAEACGCLSPPAPVGDEEFAVNQQAEQIIFEVEPGFVTAHVLIQYAGAPASFAWIVPVPTVPELSLSATGAFGLLDALTAPAVGVGTEDICPVSAWQCRYHPSLYCGDDDDPAPDNSLDAGAGASDAGGGPPDGVVIVDRQTVGDYDTIIFSAGDTGAAVAWLQGEGFIVNATMAPYMQPYAYGGMLFVAAKLLPGADATAIKPLRMRFAAAAPMIPLMLTAVAAEPHLTVTAFVYGDRPVRPAGHPLVEIDPDRLATDGAGRFNYPMVLARAIDEAGGDGFAVEYLGGPPVASFNDASNCCGNDFDACGLGDNGQCECPRDGFDATDCSEEVDLLEGIALLDDLAARHTVMTRLTTRLSADEMTFDPMFEPVPAGQTINPVQAYGTQLSLAACEDQVFDFAMYQELRGVQDCAAVYCGPGACASTWAGAGCACDAGTVARVFTDLDGEPSVTCVPETPPVDLEAGGLDLPDACATLDCGLGRCVDLNGVPACDCNGGAVAVTDVLRKLPYCRPIDELSGSPGADDYSDAYRELAVCAPPPPRCETGGWLVNVGSERPGANCGGQDPLPGQTVIPDAPTCEGAGILGMSCGCRGGAGAGGATGVIGGLLLLVALRPRRRAA